MALKKVSVEDWIVAILTAMYEEADTTVEKKRVMAMQTGFFLHLELVLSPLTCTIVRNVINNIGRRNTWKITTGVKGR